jgi:hypothetical protein
VVFDDGSGSGPALYAGGSFNVAGGSLANYIAKWNGQAWSGLGSGLSLWVNALTVFDDGSGSGPALFAGGSFDAAGGVSAKNIAKWDGQSWSAVGSGVNSAVYALSVYNDGGIAGPMLYVGGQFTTVGGVSAECMAKWDGQALSPLDSGVNNRVAALAVLDNGSGVAPLLYAAGAFTSAAGAEANRVAQWDGQKWSALGSGMNSTVSALAVFDDGSGSGPALYAAGTFTLAGGVAVNRIAKWDGQTWSALGSGLNGNVGCLTVFDDGSGSGPALYAGGGFGSAGGVAAAGIAKWDGQTWSPLGSGLNANASVLTVFDDGSGTGPALYAGGNFNTAGGKPASRIAKWDGQTWSALGSGVNNLVASLAVFDDGSGSGPALYAGGIFINAGGIAANRIAKWDGQNWSALGSGITGPEFSTILVDDLTVFDDGSGAGPALYVGGEFTAAGGVAANQMAKWDGQTWSGLGSGFDDGVIALTVFDDQSGAGPALIAGGWFISPSGAATAPPRDSR